MIAARNLQNALARLTGRALPPAALLPLPKEPAAKTARRARLQSIVGRKPPEKYRQGAAAQRLLDKLDNPDRDLARAEWLASTLQQHLAPVGDDVKRYSPHGFPAPVWSLDDLARPDGRKFSKATGAVLISDPRPKWARVARQSFSYNKTTGQYTPKRAAR